MFIVPFHSSSDMSEKIEVYHLLIPLVLYIELESLCKLCAIN